MFTGIIQNVGILREKSVLHSSMRISVEFQHEIYDLSKGESIALDGICLTVEKFTKTSYTCYVSPTTAECTNITALELGTLVNLERALRPTDRMGGHFVTGHIDTVATLLNKEDRDGSLLLHFSIAKEYSPYILNKGSIAINGISLTVTSYSDTLLTVTIIPETQKQSTIASWNIGQCVNIETDMLGKYVINMLSLKSDIPTLTKGLLQEYGFLK
ncbi:MAG: riboflavin synthase [Desulfovibrionaceae bacterium]